MRRVREILQLKFEAHLSGREVARRSGMGETTVREMLKRFEATGLEWPLSASVTDAELEQRLYGRAATRQGQRRRSEPDWAAIHRELKKKHVTLQIVWDEYIAGDPDGYRYSRFCELYRDWESRVPVTMRQTHLGGDKMFVDYAGDTVPVIVDRRAGKVQEAHLFVAVLGGSSLSFALATWTETLPDWIEGHVQALAYFGGAPALIVPDNPKVAVIRACFYDPDINKTYAELAAHYGTSLLPARPRRPRDKAKVEALVRIVERWLLGKLRRQRFYSLAEVNAAIASMLQALNDERILRIYRKTRRQMFEEIDRPKLRPLPVEPFVLAEWKRRKAGIDYHVEFDRHFYSIPYRYARCDVELRATRRTIEIFLHGERIACHVRGSGDGKHTTLAEHMPSSHRRYDGMTPAALLRSAEAVGPNTALLCQRILDRRPHPEQGFRTCLGVVRMAKVFGAARLEAACERALEIGALNYGSIKSILDNRLEGRPINRRGEEVDQSHDLFHTNIRGSTYYH